ncbi:gamma subclass chorismate mutase AroQ [Actinoallomurus acaciae]|uniref:chorismate mutase n=1 Tax=Actinoallomurus acaciae TaxID=502577 RepID=A0ABV5YD93_9ACTN
MKHHQNFAGHRRRSAVTIAVTALAAALISSPAHAAVHSGGATPKGNVVGPLGPLTSIAVQRILLGDKVAEAKFGTDSPIDDPAREQQELQAVAAMAANAGIDPDASVRFFDAQIEANKVVQRGLYALWTKHPELRPSERPDLTKDVRPKLDQITTEIIEQLKATRDTRKPTATCHLQLLQAQLSTELRARLDALHRRALKTALQPVCT